MIKSSVRTGLATLALMIALVPSAYVLAKKTELFDGEITVELRGGSVEVPIYNRFKLPSESCSGYVRRSAEKLFGKKYSVSDAWNRRYEDQLIVGVDNNEDLRKNYDDGTLKPGMIIGTYYPKSGHLKDKDATGNQVKYTHNLLFLGEGKNKKLIFAELFGPTTRTRTLEQFAEHDLRAKEIIDSTD